MRILGVAGVLVAAVCWSGAVEAGSLDKAPFTATADELLSEAKPVATVDAEGVVLRDETTITFDDAGRAEIRYRTVFVVLRQSAVDEWGTLRVEWSPFYQDKPTVRARVIGSRDQVAQLDDSLITDSPAFSESPSVYSDRRQLAVPLPRLAVGAVVEETYTIKDRVPLLRAGVAHVERVGGTTPVQRTIVTISAPIARHAQVDARGFPKTPTPRHTAHGDREDWTYDIGPTAAHQTRPERVPADVVTWPSIGVSTASSWSAVAADYREIIERRLHDGDVALPPEVKASTEIETVRRAVRWLHEHVRYTGIELSDAEITPWPPAEVVKRGFGDCKDQATLLVAILRSAGIDAELALLSDGAGVDVDRDLPGMGVFDHAIVRAKVDGHDVWIDATEESLPPGQLPSRDQGRRALVIASNTRDLVLTPPPVTAENLIREVRTFHLAEHDWASITEVSTERGVFWNSQRNWIRDSSHADATKHLAAYVSQQYGGELLGFASDAPADITQPASLTLQIGKTERAMTERTHIDVYLPRSVTFSHVPTLFTAIDDEADHDVRTRHYDYVWYQPNTVEIENRLMVPAGYTMPQFVAHEVVTLGTMTLTTDRRVEQDTLVITFRLDTGKPRMTPGEVIATRDAVLAFQKLSSEHVVISQIGADLVQAGKLKEAIAEYHRLIALHPKEALHYGQLADAYRLAGMGAAARRAVRKGVDVEPTSADAFDMLAWQLRRDTLGREYGFDADRDGALAAYRKALALSPNHIGAIADLASLLLHDERGEPTTSTPDRKEAVALWRRAKTAAQTDKYDTAIVEELLLAGELADAEASARALPESVERSQDLIAAVVAARGAPEGIKLASSLATGQDRKTVLTRAFGLLIQMRRYDAARAVFDELRGPDTEPMQIAVMSKLAAVDFAKLDPSDPMTPIVLATAAVIKGPVDRAPWSADMAHELTDITPKIRDERGMSTFKALPRDVARDLLAAMAQPVIEGSVTDGWRVMTYQFGTAQTASYVARVHGTATLIGTADLPAGVGDLMLSLLASGDLAGATRWLKRIAPDLQGQRTAPWHRVASKLYLDAAAAGPSKQVVELAAAFLVVSRHPALAIPILQRCAVPGDDIKGTCVGALLSALAATGRAKDIIDVAQRATSTEPAKRAAFALQRASALGVLGRFKEASALIDGELTKAPDDHDLGELRCMLITAAGPWADGERCFDKFLSRADVDRMDLNNVAWLHLFFDHTPEKAKALGDRAERLERPLHPSLANTLAAIEAEAERPFSAWGYMQKAIASAPEGPLDNADSYVLGRIAESYGLRDDALASYRRVPKPATAAIVPSPYDFAQRGIARLVVH